MYIQKTIATHQITIPSLSLVGLELASPRRICEHQTQDEPRSRPQVSFSFSTLDGCLQLPVFRFGLLQDGDVGVGVFPEGEEVFVGGAGSVRPVAESR